LYGDWFTHVLEWWQRCRDNKNILFLKYEDMKKDRRAAIVKIADYLGYDLNDDKINKITDHCSFKNMKKASLMEPSVRKGIVGDWKNVFTVAENEAFERIYNEKMKGTGLSFEW
ncbi:sulfotransferase 1C2A-like, partial [Saccoglossus kowalevskii]